MDFSSVNWLAVAACVVASMVIGFIWYHPKLFFNAWWTGIGRSLSDQPNPNPVIYVYTVIAGVVEAVAVSFMLATMGSSTLPAGLSAAFMIWLGFVAPTNLVNKLFAGHGFKVWAIEAGYHLVNLLAFGAILSAWH